MKRFCEILCLSFVFFVGCKGGKAVITIGDTDSDGVETTRDTDTESLSDGDAGEGTDIDAGWYDSEVDSEVGTDTFGIDSGTETYGDTGSSQDTETEGLGTDFETFLDSDTGSETAFPVDGGDDDAGLDSGDSDADTGTGVFDCTGLSDFTPCRVITSTDRDYDVCIDGQCVSPGCGDASCNVHGPHFPLADTNQRACYSLSSEIECPREGEDFYGQDAQYGWDVSNDSSLRYHRDLSVGDEPVIVDSVTSLVWQGCAAGYHSGDCSDGNAVSMSWTDSVEYCDGLEWGGYSDWRLPDEYEMESILDHGKHEWSFDEDVFQNGHVLWVWTSTSHVNVDGYYAYVSMLWGMNYFDDVDAEKGARCVRGAVNGIDGDRYSLVDGADPVVLDVVTGLSWQGCIAGMGGKGCSMGTPVVSGWKDALSYCSNLEWGGYSDWRLPSVVELRSIVDNGMASPSINGVVFIDTLTSQYWTSTTHYPAEDKIAWSVSFSTGGASSSQKSKSLNIRCVR